MYMQKNNLYLSFDVYFTCVSGYFVGMHIMSAEKYLIEDEEDLVRFF